MDEGDHPAPPPRAPRRFFGSLFAELLRTDGAKVTLRLEIEATATDGFKHDDAAAVRDNPRTLKFTPDGTGFSET